MNRSTNLRLLPVLAIGAASLALLSASVTAGASPPPKEISLQPIGTYRDGAFEVSAAEIVAHDPDTQRLFVVNADPDGPAIDVLDMSDPTMPTLVNSIVDLGGTPNSVDVDDGVVAVAVENPVKDQPGQVVFFDTDGEELNRVQVGALPDMLTFTPNGTQIVVANEGEPFAGFEGDLPAYAPDRDPVGSISIIDVRRGVDRATVRTAGFEAFDARRAELVAQGVRLNVTVPTVSQDLEPEYITVSQDSRTAWAVLQEANAIAEIDLRRGVVTKISALGRKDHSLPGTGLDPSDEDGVAGIRPIDNVVGIHMPDGIANVHFRGQTYLLTANEGDARAYTGLTDESRARDLRNITANGGGPREEALCEEEFPDREDLIERAQLGRLTVSTIDGYDPVRNCYFELHAFGARSFSVFTTDGELIWDSGDEFERVTRDAFPDFFNSGHDTAEFDNRSDNKGPEPEGITVERLNGRTYAFIGFERIGGVITYDVTNPTRPVRVDYVNNRDFEAQLAGQLEAEETGETFVPGPESGDLGPEGITVIQAGDSPTGTALVVVANEVSGTTTVFEVVRRR
jgi:2',3'-cyclic-nucleotide 2'-phosphodiesterase / 3'-nucleotidase / 5'-nucleotidase